MTKLHLPPLPGEVSSKLESIGTADILVGIPSFNNERTIGHVVRAVVGGIAKHFPDAKAVLVGSDGGSTDRTREIVEQIDPGNLTELLVDSASPALPARIVTPYHGLPGKGSALRTVFRIAADLKVRAAAVVDSDLRSITPEWVQLLLTPVLKHGYELVTPLYARHPTDGTITNTIVYPMTRALYGKRVRQPIGGDFGFSGEMAERFLAYDGWDGPVARYGIDIFMTTTALAEGRKVCQAFLGAKLHDPKDPGADLAPMLEQVSSTLFGLMERYEHSWRDVRGSEPVPLFGFPYTVALEPVPVRLDRLTARFAQAARELPPLWEPFLSQASIAAIVEAASKPVPALSDESWVRIIFETATAFRRKVLPAATLIGSILPLYLGKVATFVAETRDSTTEEAEERLNRMAEAYEREKDQLVALWQGRKPG